VLEYSSFTSRAFLLCHVDEDSAGGGDLAEQLPHKKFMLWNAALPC